MFMVLSEQATGNLHGPYRRPSSGGLHLGDPLFRLSTVVLNREYTYHLGVQGAKAGGTKHQSFQGYTLWKFKPDFIEHSS